MNVGHVFELTFKPYAGAMPLGQSQIKIVAFTVSEAEQKAMTAGMTGEIIKVERIVDGVTF